MATLICFIVAAVLFGISCIVDSPKLVPAGLTFLAIGFAFMERGAR